MENTAKRPTVIVADDNVAIHPLLCRILECELDIVENVFDGQSLVDATDCHRPDLVVVDIFMPVLDGIEAVRRIHSRYPGLPAVLISTDTGQENVQRARLAGAHGIVKKASAAEDLLPAARAALVAWRSSVNNF